MSIHAVTVRVARIPLHTPYKVSRTVFHHFEPIIVEMRDGDGRYGFGEAVISEGYAHETFDGGLRWCLDVAPRLVGKSPEEARALPRARRRGLPDGGIDAVLRRSTCWPGTPCSTSRRAPACPFSIRSTPTSLPPSPRSWKRCSPGASAP